MLPMLLSRVRPSVLRVFVALLAAVLFVVAMPQPADKSFYIVVNGIECCEWFFNLFWFCVPDWGWPCY